MYIESFDTCLQSYQGISELLKNYNFHTLLTHIANLTHIDETQLLHYSTGGTTKNGKPSTYQHLLEDLIQNISRYDRVYKLLANHSSKETFTYLVRFRLIPDKQFLEYATQHATLPVFTNEPENQFAISAEKDILSVLFANKDRIRDTAPNISIDLSNCITNLWEIPLLLHSIQPGYQYYLCHNNRTNEANTMLYVTAPKKRSSTDKPKTAVAFPWQPGWTNVELTKDCGLIPYLLHKNHNMTVTMVGTNRGEYPYLDTYVKGLQMDFLSTGDILEKNHYIMKHGKDIDCLLLRGPYETNFDLAINYKTVNPQGKIYIGLDANSFWMDRILWKDDVFIKFMNCCDVIATSCRAMQKHLNEKWPWKIEYIPNGYYTYGISHPEPDFNKKENTILTVSRLGTNQKATNILLESFARIADTLPDWKLKLVGNINQSFQPYIDSFFEAHPQLRSRIEFTGVITDKELLFEEYLKAKIFTLPSTYEGGTPNVVSEALTAGCVLAVTKFDAWEDAIDEGRCGMAAPINNIDAISNMYVQLCTHPELAQLSHNAYQYALRNYDMESIVAKLYEMLFGGEN